MFSTIIAVIVSQVVSAIWYSSFLAGSVWMRLAHPGLTSNDINKRFGASTYISALIANVFTTLLLKYFLLRSIFSVGEAFTVSLLLAGFSASLEVCHYGFQCRPWKLFLVDHLHNFVTILVICCVVVLF